MEGVNDLGRTDQRGESRNTGRKDRDIYLLLYTMYRSVLIAESVSRTVRYSEEDEDDDHRVRYVCLDVGGMRWYGEIQFRMIKWMEGHEGFVGQLN